MKRTYKVIILCMSILFAVCAVFMSAEKSVATTINLNLRKINNLSKKTLISSCPYDYIDNEYYNDIVDLGFPAVEELEEKYENGELQGLSAYIAGLAIQDITGCDMYDATGCDWSNGEEFFREWDKMVENMPDEFEEIINSDVEQEKKISEIRKYGMFGESFLATIDAQEGSGTIDYFDAQIECRKVKLNSRIKCSKKEMKRINKYIDSKMK